MDFTGALCILQFAHATHIRQYALMDGMLDILTTECWHVLLFVRKLHRNQLQRSKRRA